MSKFKIGDTAIYLTDETEVEVEILKTPLNITFSENGLQKYSKHFPISQNNFDYKVVSVFDNIIYAPEFKLFRKNSKPYFAAKLNKLERKINRGFFARIFNK
jgi:hypothetical protein